MREFLVRFDSSLCEMMTVREDLRRRIIRLFDEEATFKGLCHHHHQREHNIFFPALDCVTTDEERYALLKQSLAANALKPGGEGDAQQ